MRIVAGRFRGRRIEAPRGDTTRPTTDRVREALFSAIASQLGPDLGAGAVLDAFAGTGALGLEALSRGASSVTFVERDRLALSALRSNVAALRVEPDTRVVAGDALSLAQRGALPGGPFSLILLDPPYRLAVTETAGLLRDLAARELLEPGAIVVWEHDAGVECAWPEGFSEVTCKRYGTTAVDIASYGGESGSS